MTLNTNVGDDLLGGLRLKLKGSLHKITHVPRPSAANQLCSRLDWIMQVLFSRVRHNVRLKSRHCLGLGHLGVGWGRA